MSSSAKSVAAAFEVTAKASVTVLPAYADRSTLWRW